MKPLWEDQIHNAPFIQQCTHIWADDYSRQYKSGVYDYYVAISNEFGKPLADHTNMPDKAIIFVGMCHILEDVYKKLPSNGSYIIIHRTNDRPYTQAMHSQKPNCVKHVYTVDCQPTAPNLYAIPFGNSSINGHDPFVGQIAKEAVEPAETKIFARYNMNISTPHRNESILHLTDMPYALLIKEQIPVDEFFRQCKAHKYTMSLAGCGADASRQWSAIQLGSIPIVTDCPEMRHFEDLPMIYCPKDFKDLTLEWLDSHDLSGKVTHRMRASYWINHINETKQTL